jgi:protein-tyrosine phosphatase
VKILFVCTGNICRSPLAEGILRKKLQLLNVNAEVDSAGFEAFHAGDHPDSRAIATGRNHGVDISQLIARLFTSQDFQLFDRIYIMDDSHYYRIKQFARTTADMEKVDYLMNVIHPGKNLNVEDPWYGDLDGFEKVFNKLNEACGILAEKIASTKPF